MSEAITGFLASDTNDKKLATGHIIQSIFKGSLLTQFGRELNNFRKNGLIKEDYFATHKQQATLVEFLNFIDGEETPDEERFRAMKSIFFYSISKKASEDDEFWAYEFLQTAKKLSGTEILILKANFDLATGNISKSVPNAHLGSAQSKRSVWKRVIAAQMGYEERHAIVTKYEENLESLGLISPRGEDTRFHNEFEPTQKYRLTEVGYKFCEFITKYE